MLLVYYAKYSALSFVIFSFFGPEIQQQLIGEDTAHFDTFPVPFNSSAPNLDVELVNAVKLAATKSRGMPFHVFWFATYGFIFEPSVFHGYD